MQFFLRNCTHILTRTQGGKFDDMLLVKIASTVTPLRQFLSISEYTCVIAHEIKREDFTQLALFLFV